MRRVPRGLPVVVCTATLVCLLGAGCGGRADDEGAKQPPDSTPTATPTPIPPTPIPTPSPTPEPTLFEEPSGLRLEITHRETANPLLKAGQLVTVHYQVRLEDGTVVEDTRKADTPVAFVLGDGEVIAGWDEAFARLRVGDRATLRVPPGLGYGDRGFGEGIPPGATLEFEVEVISAE